MWAPFIGYYKTKSDKNTKSTGGTFSRIEKMADYFSYHWDSNKEMWVILSEANDVVAMFTKKYHAVIWTNILNKESYVVDKGFWIKGV